MFRAFAEAQQRAVPEVRKMRVRADKEGDAVLDGRSSVGTGYNEYAVAVVNTIRNERRGLERERQVMNSRRKDVAGMVKDNAERREDASSGRGASGSVPILNRFLFRCGRCEEPFKVLGVGWLCNPVPTVVADASSCIGGRGGLANSYRVFGVCH